MTPIEWAAIGTVLTGLVAGLGEHAAGVLIAAVTMVAYWQREKEIRALIKGLTDESARRETESDALVEKVVTALVTVGERLSAFEKSFDLDARMVRMEAERKSREDHANARTPGQS